MIIETTKHDWTFDSTEDVLDFCDTVTEEKHEQMMIKQESSFNKFSWQETIEHLKHGFTTEKMLYEKDKLTNLVKEELTKLGIKYEVTGDYLDIGAYLSGQPECFASFDYFPEDKPELNIVVNLSKSAYVEPYLVENRGIAIASLIEVLKNTYNIKCFLVKATEYMGTNCFFRFNVNISGYASFNQLMTYVGHTGFYRRVCFTIMERMFDRRSCQNDSYGRPIDIDNFDKTKTLYFKAMKDDVAVKNDYDTPERSKKTVLKIVNDLKENKEKKLFKYL